MAKNFKMINQLFHVDLLLRVSSMIHSSYGEEEKIKIITKWQTSQLMIKISHGLLMSLISSITLEKIGITKIFNGSTWKIVSVFDLVLLMFHFYSTFHCMDENCRSTKLQKALGKNRWHTLKRKLCFES